MGLGSSNRASSDALMSRPPTEEFVLQHRLAQLRRLEPVGRSADLFFDPPMMRGLYPPQPVEPASHTSLGTSYRIADSLRTAIDLVLAASTKEYVPSILEPISGTILARGSTMEADHVPGNSSSWNERGSTTQSK